MNDPPKIRKQQWQSLIYNHKQCKQRNASIGHLFQQWRCINKERLL